MGGTESGETQPKVSLMIVGRLIMDRAFNIDAFKKTMMQSWGVSNKVVMRITCGKRL